MTRQLLRVILFRLPEKERKEIEDIVEEMKEGGYGRKRKMKESDKTGEIRTFPLYPYLQQGQQA